MPTLEIHNTGRSKRDLIEMAFEDCGTAGYEFERTPEEIASALRKLEVMMGEWPFDRLGYNASGYGQGLPEELSGIPDDAVHAVSMHLALRIAPAMGKSLSAEAKAAMARSFSLLCSKYAAMPRAYLAQNTPRGAGHSRRVPFIHEAP